MKKVNIGSLPCTTQFIKLNIIIFVILYWISIIKWNIEKLDRFEKS